MTQIMDAKKGILTDEMKQVAAKENVSEEFILKSVANGTIVIPSNVNRDIEASGIGAGLRTKVNATVGTSTDIVDFDEEVLKAQIAIDNGADCLMELSIGGDLDVIRRRVLDMSPLPVGSVPVYQAAIERIRKDGSVVYMEEEDLFKTIEKQAKDGIDFMAVHSSINIETLTRLKRQGRVTGLVSRGGSFMSGWIVENERENPLYSNFDYVLEIAKEHDVVLSLANGMRAGSIADSTDRAQIQELIILGELKGTVTAGAAGNDQAVILAFSMSPLQLRIADHTSRFNEKNRRLGKGTMMASVEEGELKVFPLKKPFLSSLLDI